MFRSWSYHTHLKPTTTQFNLLETINSIHTQVTPSRSPPFSLYNYVKISYIRNNKSFIATVCSATAMRVSYKLGEVLGRTPPEASRRFVADAYRRGYDFWTFVTAALRPGSNTGGLEGDKIWAIRIMTGCFPGAGGVSTNSSNSSLRTESFVERGWFLSGWRIENNERIKANPSENDDLRTGGLFYWEAEKMEKVS